MLQLNFQEKSISACHCLQRSYEKVVNDKSLTLATLVSSNKAQQAFCSGIVTALNRGTETIFKYRMFDNSEKTAMKLFRRFHILIDFHVLSDVRVLNVCPSDQRKLKIYGKKYFNGYRAIDFLSE